jgi:hypothetical protein
VDSWSIRDRIDAALAEPVDDYDIDAELRLHKEDRLRLRVENLRLTRELDEARDEVERFRNAVREKERLELEAVRELDEARAEVERLSTWGPCRIGSCR